MSEHNVLTGTFRDGLRLLPPIALAWALTWAFDDLTTGYSIAVLAAGLAIGLSLSVLFENLVMESLNRISARFFPCQGAEKCKSPISGETQFSTHSRMHAVTIVFKDSAGNVVTLPPLQPDDKASIRTFIREAEKATGGTAYAKRSA